MADHSQSTERADLLADVAEMYYLEGKIQAKIAEKIGVTRSMVSRMLTEARQQGIVEIKVNRKPYFDRDLSSALTERFGLKDAFVVANRYESHERLLRLLGAAGAHVLDSYLAPGMTLGLVWGTTMNAVVEAVKARAIYPPVRIVQLSGALDARSGVYDGHALISRLAHQLSAEAFYLNSPLLVDDEEMVAALSATPGIREAIALARECDIALLGIGGIDPQYCSYCLSGNITPAQLQDFVQAGAVGVVYGRWFDRDGKPIDTKLYDRIIGIDLDDLLAIPVRIGIAGGAVKTRAIEGALRGGYVNVIITDSLVAADILAQA